MEIIYNRTQTVSPDAFASSPLVLRPSTVSGGTLLSTRSDASRNVLLKREIVNHFQK